MEESWLLEAVLSLARWDLSKAKDSEADFKGCDGCKGLGGGNGLDVMGIMMKRTGMGLVWREEEMHLVGRLIRAICEGMKPRRRSRGVLDVATMVDEVVGKGNKSC